VDALPIGRMMMCTVLNAKLKWKRERVMNKLICHASECDNSTSETFFHCEKHGGEDGEDN